MVKDSINSAPGKGIRREGEGEKRGRLTAWMDVHEAEKDEVGVCKLPVEKALAGRRTDESGEPSVLGDGVSPRGVPRRANVVQRHRDVLTSSARLRRRQ